MIPALQAASIAPLVDLGPVAQAAAVGLAAVAGIATHPRAALLSPGTVVWSGWAGVAGGLFAIEAFSAELLSQGTGGVLIGGVGSLLAAALTAAVLGRRAPPVEGGGALPVRDVWRAFRGWEPAGTEARRPSEHPPHPAHAWAVSPRRSVLTAAAWLVASVTAAWLGLGLAAVIALLVAGAVGLARERMPVTSALFVVAAVMTAVHVVAGVLVLSPLGLVDRPVAVVTVGVLAVLPLLGGAAHRRDWTAAARRVRPLDGAAVVVAIAAGLGWWSLFRGLTAEAIISQVGRLGEDNYIHVMLLDITRTFGGAVGTTEASLEAAGSLAGYFPGPSLWQTGMGAVLPAMSTARLYIATTAALLALLALGATAIGGMAVDRWGGRQTLGALVVGFAGVRVSLALFELGFPGHLLATVWMVAAFTMLLAWPMERAAGVWGAGSLVVLIPAALWSWSLAAPLLAAPLLVMVATALRRRGWMSLTLAVRVVLLGGIAGLVGVLLLRGSVLATLETLNLDGPVFRAIPLGLTLVSVVALPAALFLLRRPLPAPATALVVSTAAATAGLAAWHAASLGALSYYTYKLQYLVVALGWAAVTLLVCAVVRPHTAARSPADVGLLLVAAPLVVLLGAWPASSHRAWLAAREVLGPDPAVTCAIAVAAAAEGRTMLGVGFGSSVSDYLATKAMTAGAGTEASLPFWRPIINEVGPATWPWAEAPEGVVLVAGPAGDQTSIGEVVGAAEAAGVQVAVETDCTTDP